MSELTKMEKLFLHAGRMLNTTIEYEELMGLVLDLTMKAVDSEAALVYRIDKNVPKMRVRVANRNNPENKYFKIDKGKGIVGWVAENREPQIVNDLASDPRFSRTISKYVDVELKSTLAIPLIGRGQMIGVVEAINKINGDFNEIDLDTLVGLANQFAVAIDNANLYRTAKRSATELKLLYEVGKKMASTLEINQVLNQIMKSIQTLVGYSSGGVFLTDEIKGEINTVYSEGYDSEHEYLQLKVGQGLVGWVARSGEPVIVGDVSKDDRYINGNPNTKSEIVVPIAIDSRVLGVLNLESHRRNAYDNRTLDLVCAFTSQAAVAIERAYLYGKTIENKRLDEQLNVARNIQLSFIPKNNPTIKGYDIAGVNIPSGEVGGDYFDFIKIIDNQTGIAIADVSGKGIPASLIMASFRASLIAEIRNNYSIRTICKKVNSLLYESVEQGNYVTAFYGVLDSKNDIFTFSNCGHNLPILIRANSSIEFLKEGGLALGVVDGAEYEERPIFLQSGDVILFYTDGVTEINDKKGREFGQDRLLEALKEFKGLPAVEMQKNIIDRVKSFAAPDHVFDDITIVILKKI
ncbi:MAG: SpoIIE family protein phosphatase [Candidatus Zixiibacteriota bacterium]